MRRTGTLDRLDARLRSRSTSGCTTAATCFLSSGSNAAPCAATSAEAQHKSALANDERCVSTACARSVAACSAACGAASGLSTSQTGSKVFAGSDNIRTSGAL